MDIYKLVYVINGYTMSLGVGTMYIIYLRGEYTVIRTTRNFHLPTQLTSVTYFVFQMTTYYDASTGLEFNTTLGDGNANYYGNYYENDDNYYNPLVFIYVQD